MTDREKYWLARGRIIRAAGVPVSKQMLYRIDRIYDSWSVDRRDRLMTEISLSGICTMLLGRLIGQGRNP